MKTSWLRQLGQDLLSGGTLKWLILGSCVGILCGVVAFILYLGVDLTSGYLLRGVAGFAPHGPAGEHHLQPVASQEQLNPWLFMLIITGGGFLTGLILRRCPEAAGAGTNAAIKAYHQDRGRIPFSRTVWKLLASIITLGTGGSAGKEGPISLIGSGLASSFAVRLQLSGRDRRILLAAGIGAGVAALFRAPLAGAIFAAEVLYADSELEADVIIPSFIASIVGFVVFGLIENLVYYQGGGSAFTTLFATPDNLSFTVDHSAQLLGYGLLSLVIVIVVRFYVIIINNSSAGFKNLKLPLWLKPALGAAMAGSIGVGIFKLMAWFPSDPSLSLNHESVLSVLGNGYGAIQQALLSPTVMSPELQWSTVALLVVIAGGKMITSACTVTSGGSGGIFGPSMVIGGCMGGAVGIALSGLAIAPPPGACVIIGMAGFFACAYRTPIAGLLMVSELTGTYELLLPAMWVCSLCFLAGKRHSLASAQVPSPIHSPAHSGHFFNDLLSGIRVREVFDPLRPVRVLHPDSSLDACKQLVTESKQTVYPVVDESGNLCGIFNMNDLRSFLYDDALGMIAVADDIATKDIIIIRTHDTLASAMRRFTLKNLEELPVIEELEDGQRKFLGLIGRRQVIAHYNQVVDHLRRQRADDGYDNNDDQLPPTMLGGKTES